MNYMDHIHTSSHVLRRTTCGVLVMVFPAMVCFTLLRCLLAVVVHDGQVLEKPVDEEEVQRNVAGYAVSSQLFLFTSVGHQPMTFQTPAASCVRKWCKWLL